MAYPCELCGKKFDSSQLDSERKMVLDSQGKWKMETTYRCFDCAKRAVLGRG